MCAVVWNLARRPADGQHTPVPPPGFAASFEELVSLTRGAHLTAAGWAHGSVLIVRLCGHGSAGVPYLRYRFEQTAVPEEAVLAAAYLSLYGVPRDHAGIRRELESDPRKRAWLRELFGDGKAMADALRAGVDWEPAAQLLPSPDGYRNLALLCVRSSDVLVRRAGLYWGFWVPDDAYWEAVQRCADRDPDPLTKRFARCLLKNRARSAP
jgi:hypothetical protein